MWHLPVLVDTFLAEQEFEDEFHAKPVNFNKPKLSFYISKIYFQKNNKVKFITHINSYKTTTAQKLLGSCVTVENQ